MKLLWHPASPFGSKVSMAASSLGIEVEMVRSDTLAAPPELVDNNPLGKLPVLLRDGKQPIFDSVAIMHFLDRHSGGRLYPADGEERATADVLEALCDGIVECLLAIVYERRFRPEEKVHDAWIDKQWVRVMRGLDSLQAKLPQLSGDLHGGHFALAALLGYLDLRFAGKWEEGRQDLVKWPVTFALRFPGYLSMKPLAG